MKKILIYLMVFILVFVSTISFSVRDIFAETDSCGHSVEERNGGGYEVHLRAGYGTSDETEYVYTVYEYFWNVLQFGVLMGIEEISEADWEVELATFSSAVLGVDYYYFLEEILPGYINADGNITLSAEVLALLQQLADYLLENGYKEVDPDDYYTRYVTDTSSIRVPVANVSYNYFMDYTGEEGEAVIDEVSARKYYWINFGGSSLTTSSSDTVQGVRFAYVPEEYEDNVVFIATKYHSDVVYQFEPYVYNSSYMTFTEVPYTLINWEVSTSVSKNNYYDYTFANDNLYSSLALSSSDVVANTFYRDDVYTGDFINKYYNSTSAVWYSYMQSYKSTNTSDYSDYGYYGTTSFVIWKSEEAYIEWMTMYPNFDQTQQVIYNEDNSVTITNVYNTTNYGDTDSTDYSDILTQIDEHIVSGFEDVVDALGGGSGGYSSALDDIIEQLKKINQKLLYSDIIETLDLASDWLTEALGLVGDEATETAQAALVTALEAKFPFSIVSDFAYLVLLFEVEPIEPVWDIPFNLDALGIHEVVTIDLTQFQAPIKALQWFVVVMWVYGLMRLTMAIFSSESGEP